MGEITLKEEGRRVRPAGHPWIFRGALGAVKAENGDIVTVWDARRRFVGRGFYSAASQIAVRLFDLEESFPETPDWKARLEEAFRHRERVIVEANAYRLVSSEADRLPGLIIDRYDDHLVMQTLCPGTERLQEVFLEILLERFRPTCVVERNDVQVRRLEGLPSRQGVLHGDLRQPLVVQEGSVHYEVDLLGGQKTGAYLDQRENRLRAAAFSSGRVLDAFCYQGGFALHEARAADEVLAVDSSSAALEVAARNAALNGLANITFRKAKVFDLLRDLRGHETFDLVSLDPPAFAKSAREVEGAERGYREINLRAMEILKPGGYLITSSCSYHMTEERLLAVLRQAAGRIGRFVRVIEKRTQSQDHPILLNMPESHYLKCLILQIF